MSKTIKRNFGFQPEILGRIKSAEGAQLEAATLTHNRPWLSFDVSNTVAVNNENEPVSESSENFHHFEPVTVRYHIRIDPKKYTKQMANHIAAVTERMQAVQGYTDAAFAANSDKKVTIAENLPSTPALIEIYNEYDEAQESRLLEMVVLDEDGNTMWDYINADGEPVNLSKQLMKTDPPMAVAVLRSLNRHLNPTKPSLEETSPTKKEKPTKDSTQKTQKATSAESPSGLSEVEPTIRENRAP